MRQRVYLWDNLKVITMLMVVMTHSICPYQSECWTGYYWILIMTFSMPLFTIISGYWYKPRTFKHVFLRFLYPCILFSGIIFVGGGEFYEPYKKQIPYLNFGYAMWYLWALFVYYLITPYLLRHFQLKTILIVSFFIALIVGIIPYINMTFQFSRVICFYPFFLLGVILKEKYESYIYTFTQRKKAVFVMSICILIYVIAQASFPGIVFATGFTNGYGLHLSGLIFRLFTQIMCIIMSLSMILIIPNKQFWFTRYGSRTMNVYLLHMLIVFPICWHYCTPFMHTWYGYTTMIILVPLLCCLLFGTWIDKMMRKILLLNNYPSSNK